LEPMLKAEMGNQSSWVAVRWVSLTRHSSGIRIRFEIRAIGATDASARFPFRRGKFF
jgi:hypothetical protein